MNYQKASYVRRKSLISLIGEKKFEEGKGFGAAVGGAVSDKFKAYSTKIKENLDPLNLVRKTFGDKGIAGDLGDYFVTALGKKRKRSQKDISYFGGFTAQKNKKDPQFTTISAGPIKPLKSGDSISNILGKIYNFMVKSDELYRLNDEIEKTFREEQLDEDGRRHDALVKAIKDYMKKDKTAIPKKKDEKKLNFLEGFLEFLEEVGIIALAKALLPVLIMTGGLVTLAIVGGLITNAIANLIKQDPQAALAGKGGIGATVAGLGAESQLPAYDAEEEKQNNLSDQASLKKGQLTYQKDITKLPLEVLEAKRKQLIDYGDPRPMIKKGKGTEKDKVKAKQLDDIEAEIASRKEKTAVLDSNSNQSDVSSPNTSSASAPAAGGSTSISISAPAAGGTTAPSAPAAGGSTATSTGGSTAPAAMPMQSTPKAIPQPSSSPSIPEQLPPERGLSQGEQMISVNNKVNTFGGQPPKVIQTETAMPRNDDIMRQLKNIAVPV